MTSIGDASEHLNQGRNIKPDWTTRMQMKYLIFFLYLTLNSCFCCFGKDVTIIRREGKNYLCYKFEGRTNEVIIPYPFDSAVLADRILCINKSDTKACNVEMGNVLLVSICDFNFSIRAFLFFINENKNEVLSIDKPNSFNLETGLPFFLVKRGSVVTVNKLAFIDSNVEKNYAHYYEVFQDKVMLTMSVKYTFSESEMNEENFIARKIYRRFYRK